MLEKIKNITDNTVNSLKNISLTRGLEIGAGIFMLIGTALIKSYCEDTDILATEILNNETDGVIEIDDAEVSTVDDLDEKNE